MKRLTCTIAFLALFAFAALPLAGCTGDSPSSGSGSSAPLTAQKLDSASSSAAGNASSDDGSAAQEPGQEASSTASGDAADGAGTSASAADAESAVVSAVRAYARDTFGMSGDIVVVADVVSLDDSDAGSVTAYGCFGAYGFDRDGSTLVMQSAANDTGAVHLVAAGNGYETESVEFAEDGAGHDESLQRICSGASGVYEQLAGATISDDEVTAAVADYVQANGLDVTAYKMTDGTKVEL